MCVRGQASACMYVKDPVVACDELPSECLSTLFPFLLNQRKKKHNIGKEILQHASRFSSAQGLK